VTGRSPIVGAEELRHLLASTTPPVVLDVRWSLAGPPGRSVYAEGHIPGAVYVDLDTELADPVGDGSRGRHPLPDPQRFAAAMRRAGVTLDRGVVVADAGDGSVAARAWWLLRHHGHDDVRLLDGGLAAWRAAGGAVVAGDDAAPYDDAGPPTGSPFTASVARLRVLDADEAAAYAVDRALLDARPRPRYRGETEPVDRVAGHIPGALSAPTLDNVDADGRFRPGEELAARYAALGVHAGAPVAVSCGSGVTAAHSVLALALIGIDAGLYAGSWSEWVSDPTRPVAVGDERG
jgi:thiosulfate/3-mercaptopyruvate sulfurtransferase